MPCCLTQDAVHCARLGVGGFEEQNQTPQHFSSHEQFPTLTPRPRLTQAVSRFLTAYVKVQNSGRISKTVFC